MNNEEVTELIDAATGMGFNQAQVASHLNITATYWYQIRRGKRPLTAEVLKSVRRLRRQMSAFLKAS